MPLEITASAANGHAMPMKRKLLIQSAFDVEYNSAIEHMVHVCDFPRHE